MMLNIGSIGGYIELEDRGSASILNFERNIDKVGRAVDDFGSRLFKIGAAFTPLAVGVAGIAVSAVKAATTLNESLANTSALMTDVSGPALDRITGEMKTKVRAMAVDLGKSTEDISGGLYEVVSTLGYTDASFGQLAVSAKAGAAGLATTKESFLLLNAVTKVYGDTSVEAYKRVGDLAFQAVNLGNTTFPQLAASMGSVTPLAKVAGVSLQELFAIMATAAGITGSTAEATTQMASAINALLNPSKALAKYLDEQGLKSGQALIAERGLVGALQDITKYSEATGVPMLKLLHRKEAFILTAALAGEQAHRFSVNLDEMGKAYNANGSIVESAFEKQTQGINKVGFAWTQFKVDVQVALQELGDTLIPYAYKIGNGLKPIWEAVKDTLHWFEQAPKAAQIMVLGISSAIVAMPGAFIALGLGVKMFAQAWEGVKLGAQLLGWNVATGAVEKHTAALAADTIAQELAADAAVAASTKIAAAQAAQVVRPSVSIPVPTQKPFSQMTAAEQAIQMEAWQPGSATIIPGVTPKVAANAAKQVKSTSISDDIAMAIGAKQVADATKAIEEANIKRVKSAATAADDIVLALTAEKTAQKLAADAATNAARDIEVAAFKAGESSIKVGLLETAWQGVKTAVGYAAEVLTGISGTTVAIGTAVVVGTGILVEYTVGWGNLVQALKDTVSWIGEVTGAKEALNQALIVAKGAADDYSSALSNAGTIAKNVLLIGWTEIKSRAYELAATINDQVNRAFIGLTQTIEFFSGTTSKGFAVAIQGIGANFILQLGPIRDFIQGLNLVKIPISWLTDLDKVAKKSEDVLEQSKLRLAGLQLQAANFVPSGVSLSSNPVKYNTTVSTQQKDPLLAVAPTWDAALNKVEFSVNKVSDAVLNFGKATKINLGAAVDATETFADKLDDARARLSRLSASDKKDLAAGIASKAFTDDDLIKRYNLSAEALKVYRQEVEATINKHKPLQESLDKIKTAYIDLTQAQKEEALADRDAGAATEDIARAIGTTTAKLNDFFKTVPTRAESNENIRQLSENWNSLARDMAEGTRKVKQGFIDSQKAERDANTKTMYELFMSRNEYSNKIRLLQGTDLERTLEGYKQDREVAIAELKTKEGTESIYYDKRRKDINDYFDLLERRAKAETASQRMLEKFNAIGAAFEKLGESLSQTTWLGPSIAGVGKIIDAWGKATDSVAKYKKSIEEAKTSEEAQALKSARMSQGYAAILGGAGSVISSTNSGSTVGRTIGGAAAGASAGLAIGAVFAPETLGLSLAIGAGVGALVGWVRGMQAAGKATDDANLQIRDMQKTLTLSYGSFAGAQKAAGALGFALTSSLDDKGTLGAKRLQNDLDKLKQKTEELNGALSDYGIKWQETGQAVQRVTFDTMARKLANDYRTLTSAGVTPERATEGMSGALSQLVVDSVTTGQKIPVALEPMIKALIKSGKLSKDAAAALLGLDKDGTGSLDDISAAAARYGLSLDQLGPKVKQLQVTRDASQIAADFKLLVDAGADINTILGPISAAEQRVIDLNKLGYDTAAAGTPQWVEYGKAVAEWKKEIDEGGGAADTMRVKIQKLVTNALSLGLTLPEELRPAIEALIKSGGLTDEFGAKLETTGRLKFSDDITKKFDTLIERLDAFIDRLSKVGTIGEDSFGRARKGAESFEQAVLRIPPLPGETGTTGGTRTPTGGTTTGGTTTGGGGTDGGDGGDGGTDSGTTAQPRGIRAPAVDGGDTRYRYAKGGVVRYMAGGGWLYPTTGRSMYPDQGRSMYPSGGGRTMYPGDAGRSTYPKSDPGPKGPDTIAAWLQPGEGIVTTVGMQELGVNNLNMLNQNPGAFTVKTRQDANDEAMGRVLPFMQQKEREQKQAYDEVAGIYAGIQNILAGLANAVSGAMSGLVKTGPFGGVKTPPATGGYTPDDTGNITPPEGYKPGAGAGSPTSNPRYRFADGGVVGSAPSTRGDVNSVEVDQKNSNVAVNFNFYGDVGKDVDPEVLGQMAMAALIRAAEQGGSARTAMAELIAELSAGRNVSRKIA